MHNAQWLAAALAAGALLGSSIAYGAGKDIPMYLAKPGDIKINGVIKEWGQSFTPLSDTVQGSSSGCAMSTALAYDDQNLYIAGEITDKRFVRTGAFSPNEDHAELVLSFPDDSGQYRTLYEIELYAGVPGKSAGQIKAKGLGVVSSGQIVEAPTHDGYDFEARIAWSLFPAAARIRSGIRGVMQYHNSNGSGIAGIIATADKISPASSMPLLPTAPEQSLAAGLLQDRGLTAPPTRDMQADVSGDAMKERVMLFDRYLVVLGPHFHEGSGYFWNDLGVDVGAGRLPMFEVRDMTGDGKAEIVLRRRVDIGNGWRELTQVLGFDSGGQLQSLFEHETGLSGSAGTIQNDVHIEPSARGGAIRITFGSATGYNATNYHEPTETAHESLLLPWGTVRSQRWEFDGRAFKKAQEDKKQAGDTSGGTAPASVPAPPPPRPPTSDELLDQVFALYKKERAIGPGTTPRFDFVTNVAEDQQTERIVAHERDIVVFGKGFKQGRGYVYLTMPQFSDPKDILDVTARDLSGDGLADIIVRGVQRTKAPEDLGAGELQREVFFVYSVSTEGIKRIFAAETALALGDKRMQGSVAFLAGSPGLQIELRPGRAVGWEKSNWPYKQDSESVSGVEPLILPWTKQPARYRFSGDKYSR